jgi:hypothetical protein
VRRLHGGNLHQRRCYLLRLNDVHPGGRVHLAKVRLPPPPITPRLARPCADASCPSSFSSSARARWTTR